MSNQMYDYGRELFLAGSISWANDTIKCALIDTGTYTFSAAHTSITSATAAFVGTASSAFAGKTVTSGIADANDVTINAVSGASIEAIIIYKDGAPGTPMIAYIDTAASGLPVTPNGGDITISWSNGTNKIFKL